MRLAWAALLVAGALLVGLRIGRPLYYTDGVRMLEARDLADAGMSVWGAPEPFAELPGPVVGRVQALPDGRVVYGRRSERGDSDLVTWDPARPSVPPAPLFALCTEHHELSPHVLPDGSVWFASDRPGGAGGYDLYRAASLLGPSQTIAPLSTCNTALDESDACVHGNGIDVVFVRSDRSRDDGDNGVLWRWRLGDERDPVPVWPTGRREPVWQDRDPVFAPDGVSLWFVRKELAKPLTLQRASWLAGALAAPQAIGAAWGTGELRAPMPLADGRTLQVVQAKGDTARLLYRCAAHEVLPWWPGQQWLEWLLLGVVLTSLLLLLLLHFGRRWSTLDLLAQCLLLSLLLHVLLFLWLMGVEIVGALTPGDDESGGFEVSVVAAAEVAASSAANGSVAAEVAFTPSERALSAPAPAAGFERAAASLPPAAEPGERAELVPGQPATEAAAIADAPPPSAVRDGHDAAAAIAAHAVPAPERTADARPTASRDAGAAATLSVTTPSSALHAAERGESRALAAGAPTPRPAAATASQASTPQPVLQDAQAAEAGVRSAADAERATLAAASSAMPLAPAATAPVATQRSAAATGGALAVEAPSVRSALPRATASAAPPTAAAGALPGSHANRAAAPVAMAMRDAAELGAPAPPRADATPTARAAVAPANPVALGPATALAPPRPARTGTTSVESPAPTAVARPGSQLARSGAPMPPSSVRLPALEAKPAPGSQVAGTPLRDAIAAGAPTAPAQPANGSARAFRPTPLAIAVPSSSAAVADRPARSVQLGAVARLPAALPPGTSLPRAGAALPIGASQALPTVASAYSNRFGPAKAQALDRFGGNEATERAVVSGLRYLASIQHADGAWGDRSEFDHKYGFVHVGKTGLCLLAFLGAGHTPNSATEHSEVTRRALGYLLAVQEADSGAFGPSSCYGHGIATYALAECYGLTKQAELRRPLERALQWILDHQGPRRDRRNRGGWGYFSPGLRAEDDYARVSVTAWMVMALESARLSGIELPADTLPRAREYLELAYDEPNGWFRYNHKPDRVNSSWPTLPASTPAAAFCLQLLGVPADDARIAAAAQYTVERRPERYRRYGDDAFVLRGQGNVYFWYYGTLCSFLVGGDTWTQWNERLRTVLPKAQNQDGSFTPIDAYAAEAGDTAEDRSYTTAMCVLCLEVYYRYFTPLLLGRRG